MQAIYPNIQYCSTQEADLLNPEKPEHEGFVIYIGRKRSLYEAGFGYYVQDMMHVNKLFVPPITVGAGGKRSEVLRQYKRYLWGLIQSQNEWVMRLLDRIREHVSDPEYKLILVGDTHTTSIEAEALVAAAAWLDSLPAVDEDEL